MYETLPLESDFHALPWERQYSAHHSSYHEIQFLIAILDLPSLEALAPEPKTIKIFISIYCWHINQSKIGDGCDHAMLSTRRKR